MRLHCPSHSARVQRGIHPSVISTDGKPVNWTTVRSQGPSALVAHSNPLGNPISSQSSLNLWGPCPGLCSCQDCCVVSTKGKLEALFLCLKKKKKRKWTQPLFRQGTESRKSWLLLVMFVQTSFSLAEGFSQQPPSNQPRDAALNFRSPAIEQRTL